MGVLTIRKVDHSLKARLRIQAARHGLSMDEEARRILAAGVAANGPATDNVADAIARIFDPLGGVNLDLPPREAGREPPRFDD